MVKCSLPLGPWYVGELMRGVYGLVGAHGLYVSGKFIPGGMTYLHASLEVSEAFDSC